MFLVDTEVKLSAIHGLGVFLLEPVRKGDLIWRFDSRIDRVYSQEEKDSLPPRTRKFLDTYATWHDGTKTWVLCGDNARHMNHSDDPNTISSGVSYGTDVAAEDLPAGTELTTDYLTICDAVRADPNFGHWEDHPVTMPKAVKKRQAVTAE